MSSPSFLTLQSSNIDSHKPQPNSRLLKAGEREDLMTNFGLLGPDFIFRFTLF